MLAGIKETAPSLFFLIFGVKQSWKCSNHWFRLTKVFWAHKLEKMAKKKKRKENWPFGKTQLKQHVLFFFLNRTKHFGHSSFWAGDEHIITLSWRCARWILPAAGGPAVGSLWKHLAPSGVQKASNARSPSCPIQSRWPDATSNKPESLPVSHSGSSVIAAQEGVLLRTWHRAAWSQQRVTSSANLCRPAAHTVP